MIPVIPIQRDPDGLPFRPGFSLTTPQTQDMMSALMRASEGTLDLGDAVSIIEEALDNGADACPPKGLFQGRPLVLASWLAMQKAENELVLRPILGRMIAAADQDALDISLGRIGSKAPKQYRARIAEMLINGGATLSSYRLFTNLSIFFITSSDSAGIAMVKQIRALGWTPEGTREEGEALAAIAKSLLPRTLDALMEAYEEADIEIPCDRGDRSPVLTLLSAISGAKRNQSGTHERMVRRILISGLSPSRDIPGQNWEAWRTGETAWIIEAGTEGASRRITRHTQPAVAPKRRSPRL